MLDEFIGVTKCGLETTYLVGSRTVKSTFEDWINVELNPSEALLNDRPEFDTVGILLIGGVLEGKLRNESEIHWQAPILGSVEVRQQTPTALFETRTARPGSGQQHEPQRHIVCDSAGKF